MTTETIMINQQINIAIAKACGWKKMNWNEATVYGSATHGFRVWKSKHQDSIMSYKGRAGERIPDYLNDLNAMHEAEKILTHDQQVQFSVELGKLTTSHLPSSRAAWMDFAIAHATAAQRAEAFLRTIGKWEEEL